MNLKKGNLEEKNNTKAYNETTAPKKCKRRKDKSDLGPNFVAPDGGWGWVVCLAAGFSNFSIFPPLQQYGLIYRQRMQNLGFDAKETTTIVNLVIALSSLIGLVNGAMFRRFTFRQVAIVGGFLAFIGIFASAFCGTFPEFVLCLGCAYGIGLGLCMAATTLAVNTYFKNNRRRATGFSWTITGLGPIIFPHITTFVLLYYGVQGTILLFSAVTLNAVLCALTLQPVLWHVKTPIKDADTNEDVVVVRAVQPVNNNMTTDTTNCNDIDYLCKYCHYQRQAKRSILSSQYLFNEDDPEKPGYEITEPGIPMLARANDGWFGSKVSLASDCQYRHRLTRDHEHHDIVEYPEYSALDKPNYFNREREDIDRYTSKISLNSKRVANELRCTCIEERKLLQSVSSSDLKLEATVKERLALEEAEDALKKSNMTFGQKIVQFFDLDLLKDFTFVNLALGMTIMMFGEMNFSVLTPFILSSFGYTNAQISLAMSLLGGMDICVRFLTPFFLEKVKLENRILFAFGIIAILIGRTVVTFTDSYNVILGVFVLIGFGKGFRTIFSPLIIPSYVPLKRLPAASGLQLVFNAIFTVTFGPILGWITDATSYKVTIHFINLLTSFALLMWLTEALVRCALRNRRT